MKDGGPAFPRPASIEPMDDVKPSEDGNCLVLRGERGMSLRDYLAAKAMQAIIQLS